MEDWISKHEVNDRRELDWLEIYKAIDPDKRAESVSFPSSKPIAESKKSSVNRMAIRMALLQMQFLKSQIDNLREELKIGVLESGQWPKEPQIQEKQISEEDAHFIKQVKTMTGENITRQDLSAHERNAVAEAYYIQLEFKDAYLQTLLDSIGREPEIDGNHSKEIDENNEGFSVMQWATIFYYADSAKALPNAKTIKEKSERFIDHNKIKTTLNFFSNKRSEVNNRINKKQDYPIDKLEEIEVFVKENYPNASTLLENDKSYLKENLKN